MKAAVLTKVGCIEIMEHEIPQISDDEVLVHVEYVGVCGSDLHFFAEGGIGAAKIQEPRILGHEACGRVEKVGKNVTDLKEGDNVVLDPGLSCGKCHYCRTGRYNLCTYALKWFLGNPWTDGAFREYMAYPADRTYKLPDSIPKIRAALIEPYCVALHAVERSAAGYGQNAVVLGAGCIGLMTLMALKAHGINEIIVVDVIESRLAKAVELGASHIINAAKENPVEKLKELTEDIGVDLVFETSGSIQAQAQTVEYLKKGGTITFVGFSSGQLVNYDISTLMRKEANIATVFRFANQHKKAIEQLADNPIELEKIMPQIYKLDNIQQAIEENIRDKDKVIKCVIEI
ncbi:alcohol dehydrogenase catalytic domain-containing protein [Petroclostridium sp. X23]|uniref:zinc-dependent alcohol dehydrogenase n=1 Tax=Petroclostridium sp. X23 TaxID=3045146 RepID=UPI0024AD1C22|nr:alcohol dehydrogenase catalytic domain-containing protein [Petroclostridium sp. X23]WHH56837.1 alcohol dehydrogenase catalytic domain-containing protein [Petroclostridium sp. X23]